MLMCTSPYPLMLVSKNRNNLIQSWVPHKFNHSSKLMWTSHNLINNSRLLALCSAFKNFTYYYYKKERKDMHGENVYYKVHKDITEKKQNIKNTWSDKIMLHFFTLFHCSIFCNIILWLFQKRAISLSVRSFIWNISFSNTYLMRVCVCVRVCKIK